MDNLEYLEEIKKNDKILSMGDLSQKDIEYRKTKALEILAEEAIIANKTMSSLIDTKYNTNIKYIRVVCMR